MNPLLFALAGALAATTAALTLGRTERSREGTWHSTGLSSIGSAIMGSFFLALGFLIAGAWSQFDTATNQTWDEARATTALYETASPTTRPAILTYINTVRLQEIATGEDETAGRKALDEIRHRTEKYEPEPRKAQVLANLKTLQEARETRVEGAHATMPTALYTALVCAGLLVLLWPPLVGLQATRRDATALALVGALVGTATWIAFAMSTPYGGSIHVPADAYTWAHHRVTQLDPNGR